MSVEDLRPSLARDAVHERQPAVVPCLLSQQCEQQNEEHPGDEIENQRLRDSLIQVGNDDGLVVQILLTCVHIGERRLVNQTEEWEEKREKLEN